MSDHVKTLAELGFLPAQIETIERFMNSIESGMIVIGGLTNSGTTTTATSIAALGARTGMAIAWNDDVVDENTAQEAIETTVRASRNGTRALVLATIHSNEIANIPLRLKLISRMDNIDELLADGTLRVLLIQQSLDHSASTGWRLVAEVAEMQQ